MAIFKKHPIRRIFQQGFSSNDYFAFLNWIFDKLECGKIVEIVCILRRKAEVREGFILAKMQYIQVLLEVEMKNRYTLNEICEVLSGLDLSKDADSDNIPSIFI